MGKAERTRISQRMSQHIMQLKLALRMASSVKTNYLLDGYVYTTGAPVCQQFFPEMPRMSFQPALSRLAAKRIKGIDGSGKIMYNIVK